MVGLIYYKLNRYCQYHGYWWPGDARSQGISSHGIVHVIHDCIFWNKKAENHVLYMIFFILLSTPFARIHWSYIPHLPGFINPIFHSVCRDSLILFSTFARNHLSYFHLSQDSSAISVSRIMTAWSNTATANLTFVNVQQATLPLMIISSV